MTVSPFKLCWCKSCHPMMCDACLKLFARNNLNIKLQVSQGTAHVETKESMRKLRVKLVLKVMQKETLVIKQPVNTKSLKNLCLNYFTVQSTKSSHYSRCLFLQNSSIQSFNKHLLSVSYVPENVLDIRDVAMNKTEPCSSGACLLKGNHRQYETREQISPQRVEGAIKKNKQGKGIQRVGGRELFYIRGQRRFLKRLT